MSKDKKDKEKQETIETNGEARKQEKKMNFVRLARKRTQAVLDKLDLLGKLSNKGNYTYTPSQVGQIMGAILTRVEDVSALFSSDKSEKNGGFDFE